MASTIDRLINWCNTLPPGYEPLTSSTTQFLFSGCCRIQSYSALDELYDDSFFAFLCGCLVSSKKKKRGGKSVYVTVRAAPPSNFAPKQSDSDAPIYLIDVYRYPFQRFHLFSLALPPRVSQALLSHSEPAAVAVYGAIKQAAQPHTGGEDASSGRQTRKTRQAREEEPGLLETLFSTSNSSLDTLPGDSRIPEDIARERETKTKEREKDKSSTAGSTKTRTCNRSTTDSTLSDTVWVRRRQRVYVLAFGYDAAAQRFAATINHITAKSIVDSISFDTRWRVAPVPAVASRPLLQAEAHGRQAIEADWLHGFKAAIDAWHHCNHAVRKQHAVVPLRQAPNASGRGARATPRGGRQGGRR